MSTVVVLLVRFVAVVLVVGFVATFLFVSGWFTFSPDNPGRLRHHQVDWVCPRCERWGTAYVSRIWRTRARRRAIGLLHRRLAPECAATDRELLIVS